MMVEGGLQWLNEEKLVFSEISLPFICLLIEGLIIDESDIVW